MAVQCLSNVWLSLHVHITWLFPIVVVESTADTHRSLHVHVSVFVLERTGRSAVVVVLFL